MLQQTDFAERSLGDRVREGVAWSAASLAITYLTGLARSVVMARLLAPEDFGLFGMAITVLVAAGAVSQIGLDMSLIVNRFSDDEEFSSHLNTVDHRTSQKVFADVITRRPGIPNDKVLRRRTSVSDLVVCQPHSTCSGVSKYRSADTAETSQLQKTGVVRTDVQRPVHTSRYWFSLLDAQRLGPRAHSTS